MKISGTQYRLFCRDFKAFDHVPLVAALRYGQAFFNYFELYKITSEPLKTTLDKLYNNTDNEATKKEIETNFVDWEQ